MKVAVTDGRGQAPISPEGWKRETPGAASKQIVSRRERLQPVRSRSIYLECLKNRVSGYLPHAGSDPLIYIYLRRGLEQCQILETNPIEAATIECWNAAAEIGCFSSGRCQDFEQLQPTVLGFPSTPDHVDLAKLAAS
jgi:hypothetical protein